MSGTLRGRLGYVHGNWLIYGTAGYAWSYDHLTAHPAARHARRRHRRSRHGREGECVAQRLGGRGRCRGAGRGKLDGQPRISVHRLWRAAAWRSRRERRRFEFRPLHPERADGLELSIRRRGRQKRRRADAAGLQQLERARADDLRAAVRLPVPGALCRPEQPRPGQTRETWDATFYVGWRLWRGAELWINPEIDQGFGLSGTLGVAGLRQRRGLQARRELSLHTAAQDLHPPDHRSGRREREGGGRTQPARRLADGQPAGGHGWKIRGHGHLRYQQVRPRCPLRLPQLGAHRHRVVRLRLRCLGLHLRRGSGMVPGPLDAARRPVRSLDRAQQHRAGSPVRAGAMGRRDRAAL